MTGKELPDLTRLADIRAGAAGLEKQAQLEKEAATQTPPPTTTETPAPATQA